MRNLITDVPGVLVGNAQDWRAATGVTVALFEQSTVASIATLGGAPGSRAVTLLEPEMTRGLIDAVVLSGGSLFGLDAAGGATAVLVSQKRGAMFGGITLPVAVQAILFDLMNGGEKDWIKEPMTHKPPYWDLGRDAVLAAAAAFALGTVGAGVGAIRFKGQPAPATATTIALVATDAQLSKAACKRLAIMANDGLARALRPVHAPNDGDTVFAAATGHAGPGGEPPVLTELGAAAADCLARAVARGIYEATALPYAKSLPDWRSKFDRH